MDERLLTIILFMPGFLFSLAFHETAHGFVANLKGDPTAKLAGRVTLNPVPHIDPIGTLLLPILGLWTGLPLIGWGRPVPVDYRNLKNFRRDALWISLAGPASNFFLALVFAGIVKYYFLHPQLLAGFMQPEAILILGKALVSVLFLNLGLCFFNLIPIDPLDGGKILAGILPRRLSARIEAFTARFGLIILLLLVFSGMTRYLIVQPVFVVSYWLLGDSVFRTVIETFLS